ncbi:phosphonopyruvate decarboxylase-like [Cloeon dipterum]
MFSLVRGVTRTGFCCVKNSRLLTTVTPPRDRSREQQVQEQQQRNAEAGHLTELVRDFLDPGEFYQAVRDIGIDFFCGVPDSLLKDFCAFVTSNVPASNHIIASNEGNAVSIAAGYHLATNKSALVYLQNSGLGNTVNPLVSMTSREVYSMPLLLLVGWRGEPGKRDEPQHLLQGQVTPGLLAALGIPFQSLPDYFEGARDALYTAKKHMQHNNSAYCLLVKRQTFLPHVLPPPPAKCPLKREDAVKLVVANLKDRDVVVSTTGMLSRELFEYRKSVSQGHERDFLTVGSMGHASSIALGIAIQRPKRQIFCIDGDGSVIMHMGALAVIGQTEPQNFKHIIINNGTHDSVGGQPSAALDENKFQLVKIALACGYKEARSATTLEEIKAGVEWMHSTKGPIALEIKVSPGSRKNLGRPTRTPIQNKKDFMHFLALS